MEGLAAISFAGNIVSFVDFSCKLFSQATAIHHSTTGAARDTQDLEIIAQSLQSHCVDLSAARHSPSNQNETTLRAIAKECVVAAEELISALQTVKAKDPNSKWSSFRAALAKSWKNQRIEDMARTLETQRNRIIFHLLNMESEKTTVIMRSIERLSDTNRLLGAEMRSDIADLKKDVVQIIQGLAEESKKKQHQHDSCLPRPTERLPIVSSTVDMNALASALAHVETQGAKITTALALLETLTFEQMDFRHSKIHNAHPSTFMWMFSNRFKQWLQSEDPIFWISGKPGSGKSTLMKYLVDNPETPVMLREWCGQKKQVIASYFFWINGTEMQRSQEGLLQSLLYGLLRQCPELIKPTLPDLWTSVTSADAGFEPNKYIWRRSELLDAFKRLTQFDLSGTKFCIFIDGLDEYEGDHDELIDLIHDLTKLDVKLCVASRPWNVFEDVFGKKQECKLYLQDLNKGDIQRYVDDKLRSRQDFQRVQSSNSQVANEMLEEIVEKSQGVFLWVFLVVRSLIEGLRNHDRLSQLNQRLRAFPSDLSEFFGHIFQSLDPTYRVQAAHMCQVTLSAAEPITPLGYWYLDEEEDNPNIALTMPTKPRPAQTLDYYMEEMKIRINGRCKGLLEVTTTEQNGMLMSRVDFLHRTVKDFLKTSEMQLVFAKWQHEGFNPDFAICKASLAEVKSVALTKHYPALPSIFVPLRNFISSSGLYEKTCQNVNDKKALVAHFDALEQTMMQHALTRSGEPKHYPFDRFGGESLLEVAVRLNLQTFTQAKLNDPSKPVSTKDRQSLLQCGLHEPPKTLSPSTIVLLLSVNPPLTLDTELQDVLAVYLEKLDHDALLDTMKEISKCSGFQMSTGRVQSVKLNDLLHTMLLAEEIDDLQLRSKRKPPTMTFKGLKDESAQDLVTSAQAGPERNSSLRTMLRRLRRKA